MDVADVDGVARRYLELWERQLAACAGDDGDAAMAAWLRFVSRCGGSPTLLQRCERTSEARATREFP